MTNRSAAGIEVLAPADEQILTKGALEFVELLQRELGPARAELLERRHAREGERPDFLADTRAIRESEWRVTAAPPDLRDRRCEITGPPDRKMMINALNSGARVFMVDFEDSLLAHVAERRRRAAERARCGATDDLARDHREELPAERRDGDADAPPARLASDGAARACRWRAGVGKPVRLRSRRFHNAAELLDRGSGPYFYLPKLESHLEARLWAQAFGIAEEQLGLPPGSIRCTVLIETILAAFEMEEILYELREHGCALNAGRWDYIFSAIKKLDALLPDRSAVTMTVPFMRAYSDLLVRSCHRHGAHAIGGMAAFIPSRTDPEVNEVALAKVREDKERESGAGFDGTWVAHPGPRAGRDGGVRRRARRAPKPTRPSPRRRRRHGRAAAGLHRSRAARSPKPGSTRTSRSAPATSTPGCTASAPRRSTT